MASTGDLKRRIRGITNTKKITKAMELVAASKMRRAVAAALATRTYAYHAWAMLTNLSAVTNPELHPLLVKRNVRRALCILFSSDRGLAGGLTAQLVRRLQKTIASFGSIPADVLAFGKKGQDAARRLRLPLIAAFPNPFRQPVLQDIFPVARIAMTEYLAGTYDRVVLVWTDYHSAIRQEAKERTILPIERTELEATIKETAGQREFLGLDDIPVQEYLFEPSAEHVLERMLTRLLEMQLYQVVLDATASEHAARMMAMRNASDAAADLIDDLVLTFNQVRQAVITKDLSEISASRAALETT